MTAAVPAIPSPRWTRHLPAAWEMAASDFRVKYRSALGYLWFMAGPALMVGVFYVVFRHALHIEVPGYFVYLVVGLLHWHFFQDCGTAGLLALSSKASLLKAVPFPPALVVAAAAATSVLALLVNVSLLALALAVSGRLSPLAPWAVVPLLCLVLYGVAVAYLVALAHAHFRDTPLMFNALLQAYFWLTPVVYYPMSPDHAEILYLNPLARCLFLIRWFLVADYMPAARFVWFTVAACALAAAFAIAVFLRVQPRLPERL